MNSYSCFSFRCLTNIADYKPLVFNPIIHQQQKDNWDCGPTCVFMICKQHQLHLKYEDILKKVGTKSVWTIDLMYLLHRINIPSLMTTDMIGMSNDYKENSFYADEWDADETRVMQLFRNASREGIKIENRKVSIDELKSLLYKGHRIILLCDRRYIQCKKCTILFGLMNWIQTSFIGHFIVLVGITVVGTFIYSDPASNEEYCYITEEDLDKARKSFGTDQDMIDIFDVH